MISVLFITILLGSLAFAVIFVIALYNGLVRLRNRYKNAFAQIDVQLKRRYELIPNLVETVKGYMKHERETLEAVIQARNVATSAREHAVADPGNASAMSELANAETGLGGVLGRLFALTESYPDLRRSLHRQNPKWLFPDKPTTMR